MDYYANQVQKNCARPTLHTASHYQFSSHPKLISHRTPKQFQWLKDLVMGNSTKSNVIISQFTVGTLKTKVI